MRTLMRALASNPSAHPYARIGPIFDTKSLSALLAPKRYLMKSRKLVTAMDTTSLTRCA